MVLDRSNWAGNVHYAAADIVAPTTLAEAQRVVADARRVRPLGTRHSFNTLPDTDGTLIHLGELPMDAAIDRDRLTVTVSGATRYGVLAQHLEDNQLALPNMGSLPHISVAGAISTGTHGSGNQLGNLSSAVRGLQFIGPSGDLVDVRAGDPGFDGMVVGLGAFGPITRVTLAVQPSYRMRQDAFVDLPWRSAIDDFDEVMGLGYSVSLLSTWTTPAVQHLWVKSLVGASSSARPEDFGAVASGEELGDNKTPFGVEGPWCDRLPHFRLDRVPSVGEEIQTEYLIPRERTAEAMEAMLSIGRLLEPVMGISELRTVAADGLWLSPAYGRDSACVHFTFRPDPEGVTAVLPEIEARLLPLGARPHWGKLFAAPAEVIRPLYPRLNEWLDLVVAYDPAGKFRNAFLEHHLFGA